MPRTPRRLAFLVSAQLIAQSLLIASAGAQIQAPARAQKPPPALQEDVLTADAAVGMALAFLSTYSPLAENAARQTTSWKAKSVGDTWEVRETRSPRAPGDAFVVVVDKKDGRILSVVQEP